MSANGRFIAFDSQATDLANDNNGNTVDVFVRDMDNGVTTLVSVNTSGTGGGNAHSRNPVVSTDGRYVAFHSRATDLANVNDPNGTDDLFIRDLQTQTTVIVTVDPTGANAANTDTFGSQISRDGRFVLFVSLAANLTSIPDTNNEEDIFVRDLQTGVTTLINTNLAGRPTGVHLRPDYIAEFANPPQMSGDGRYVVFHTTNNNMVILADTNGTVDVFVRDNQTGEIRLLSANHAGTAAGNSFSYNPVISRDGRRVAFLSAATDLVATPPDLNGSGVDVFVHDLATSTTTLLSYNHRRTGSATGDTGPGDATVGISGSGNVVTFTSGATNPVHIADTNRNADVFFRRLGP